jgi:hypothetical protein
MYDSIHDEKSHIEIDILSCTDLGAGYDFVDELFMELHFDQFSKPNPIRRRLPDSEEDLILFETHFDCVKSSSASTEPAGLSRTPSRQLQGCGTMSVERAKVECETHSTSVSSRGYSPKVAVR